jgi:hypothetical protein
MTFQKKNVHISDVVAFGSWWRSSAQSKTSLYGWHVVIQLVGFALDPPLRPDHACAPSALTKTGGAHRCPQDATAGQLTTSDKTPIF